MHDLESIIQDCKIKKSGAQKQLYDRYKDILYAICIRYIKNATDAEDVFIEAFYKIFHHIDQYHGDGSFEGWMKRIVVNEALQFLRKKSRLAILTELTDHTPVPPDREDEWYSPYELEEIMAAVQELPDGYRTIFNMYVFEEYKHREIAELLRISINTSKSQYLLAKKKLIDMLSKTKSQINKP